MLGWSVVVVVAAAAVVVVVVVVVVVGDGGVGMKRSKETVKQLVGIFNDRGVPAIENGTEDLGRSRKEVAGEHGVSGIDAVDPRAELSPREMVRGRKKR